MGNTQTGSPSEAQFKDAITVRMPEIRDSFDPCCAPWFVVRSRHENDSYAINQ